MTAPLLQTKLFVPPPRPSLISRPRLIDRLNEGLAGKLTLVSAPPGFGKTTLISSWIQQLERPSAWLSLGKEDNEISRFLLYLIAAWQNIVEDVGEKALSLLQSSPNPPAEPLLTLLINDLSALSHQSILVLDDYHFIQNLDIHKAMIFLLDNLPAQHHLVMISREDPPLPLHRLRSRGELTGIYVHDLRFSKEEATQFLGQTMKVHLSANDIAALARRTEGWVVGLQLAALSLRSLEDGSQYVQAFAGDDRYIVDYLLKEVIARQPEHVRIFLLQTAICDRFCPSLCAAVTRLSRQQANTILMNLDEANLFIIPLDNKREWYRYHHLFSDFLRLQAQQSFPAELPVLHQRAAAWCENHGLLAEAIEHALAGEDFQHAGRLIEQNSPIAIFGHAQWRTLLVWLETLPAEMIQTDPQLNLIFAWALFSTGQWQEAEPYLQAAETAFAHYKDPAAKEPMLGEVAALRSLVAYEGGKLTQSKELAAIALDLLSAENKTIRSVALLARGMAHMWSDDDIQSKHRRLQNAFDMGQAAGNITVTLFALGCRTMLAVRWGQLQQAARLYRLARMVGTVAGDILLGPAGFALVQMGEVLREWNKLAEAETILWEGIKLCQQQLGMPVWIIEGHVNLARLYLTNGDDQRAEELIQEANTLLAVALARGGIVQHLISATNVYRLRYWLMRGRQNKAARWLAEQGIGLDTAIAPEEVPYHLLLASLLLEQGKLEEAYRQLQRLEPPVMDAESPRWSVEFTILRALGRQKQGETDQAIELLIHSLQLAEPQGFIRIFLDHGQPVASLLAQAAGHTDAPANTKTILAAIKAEQPATAKQPRQNESLFEPLKKQELRILKLIAAGLSNREIAAEMHLSINTIKAYSSRIYGKLGVSGRAEAIDQAHKLDIL